MKFDRVEMAFILLSFHRLKPLTNKGGRAPEYAEKTPDDELPKTPHAKAREFKPKPTLALVAGALLRKHTCKHFHHTSPQFLFSDHQRRILRDIFLV